MGVRLWDRSRVCPCNTSGRRWREMVESRSGHVDERNRSETGQRW